MKQNINFSILRVLKILSESVLPLFFWVFLIFGFDVPYIAILTIIAAVIHEVGHLVAITFISQNTEVPRGHLSGFRIKQGNSISYQKSCIILAMGPAANLILFILTLPFRNCLNGYMGIFCIINLATAISNLLPVEGYDGYGIASQILLSKNHTDAIKQLERISFIFSVCATFFSLYLLDKFGSGYWIFGIFFAITVSKLMKSEKYDIFKE